MVYFNPFNTLSGIFFVHFTSQLQIHQTKWLLQVTAPAGKPPHFISTPPKQSEDWSNFYTRALDYLDALDIELDTADESQKAWKQLKLMFEGEDRKALQSLIDNSVMTPEHMLKPKAALDAIGTTIKSEEHFWAYRDELMSDLQQLPDEGIHALSQCICDLITKSKFGNAQTIETIKIMVLQHAVKYHEARDWIRLQDQSQLTYQALLSHCTMLEAPCEQYQKAIVKFLNCGCLYCLNMLQGQISYH